MKFTFNWLREFVSFDDAPEKLADVLTMGGFEVESLTPLSAADKAIDDWVFEVSVTPNRGDCLSVRGLAREVSALTGKTAAEKRLGTVSAASQKSPDVTIEVADANLCSRYSARIIEGVRIGQAPAWMRRRLEACGLRALNNVVDVTNYVMLETGQPLHAFDIDRLRTRRIVVRQAGTIRSFVTLDGVERELIPADLLICDGDTPIALAGVMGGRDSEVTDETHRVLLESARFDPITVRRTAKRLGLHSEASHRFERGVDPAGTVAAANHAAGLIADYSGGIASPAILDSYPGAPKIAPIVLRWENIEKLLGTKISADETEKLLGSLGMEIQEDAGNNSLLVVPPTGRPDLTREADLIEDLARLHGYQKIPSTLPVLRCAAARLDYQLIWERRVRWFLAGQGFAEVINLPFTGEAMNRAFSGLWEVTASPVPVLNPLVKESGEMRLSLLPGLIENFRFNLAHKAESVFLYHLGKSFRIYGNAEVEEKQCLAGLLFGAPAHRGLRTPGKEAPIGFLDCKGLVEGLLELFHLPAPVIWSSADRAALHPGRAADVLYRGEIIGYVGESHPDYNHRFDVPTFVVFELDFEKLVQYSPRQTKATPLPRYPAVERDFALVVDRALPSQRIIDCIDELGQALIKRVEVFDEYHGSSIPDGKKSLAYKISYRADDRTLTDSEINTLHQQLVDHVGKLFEAQRRS